MAITKAIITMMIQYIVLSPFLLQIYNKFRSNQQVARLQPSIFAHVENQLLHLLTDGGTVFLVGLKFCDDFNQPRLYLQ